MILGEPGVTLDSGWFIDFSEPFNLLLFSKNITIDDMTCNGTTCTVAARVGDTVAVIYNLPFITEVSEL